MNLYWDTSFLLSLYSDDANSLAATRYARRRKGDVVVTPLSELEFVTGLQTRLFRREISETAAVEIEKAFFADRTGGVYKVQLLSTGVFEEALQLARKYSSLYGARSLDLLHIASALHARCEVLCTFDGRQGKLAKAAGLRVPNLC